MLLDDVLGTAAAGGDFDAVAGGPGSDGGVVDAGLYPGRGATGGPAAADPAGRR